MQPEATTHFRLGNSFFPIKCSQVVYRGQGFFEVENNKADKPTQVRIKQVHLKEVLQYLQGNLCNQDLNEDYEFVWQEKWNWEEAAHEEEKPAKPLPKFKVGDKVFARDKNTENWYAGTIKHIGMDYYIITYVGAYNEGHLPEDHIVPQLTGRATLDNTWVGKKVLIQGELRSSKMIVHVIRQLIADTDNSQYYGFLNVTGTFVPLPQIVGVC